MYSESILCNTKYTIVKKTPIESRLKPPAALNLVAEKKEFNNMVSAYSGDFFNIGDLPLLINYVRLKLAADRLYKKYSVEGEVVDDGRGGLVMSPYFNAHTKACSTMATMAQKLRLAPSARMRQEAPTQSSGRSTMNQDFSPDGDQAKDWRDYKDK